MNRSLGIARAEARDLLDEYGTSGLMTLLASVCREEIQRANREGRGIGVMVWAERLNDIVAMTDKREAAPATWVWVKDEEEDPIRLGSYLVKRGYTLIETGGNCRAWVRIMTDGEHVVVTDAHGLAEPDETDWLIGRYATEDWTDGYNARPDEEGDKTLDGFIAALDRAEGNTLAELLAGEY